jgi:thiol-disulfide isomerase/thioredoxin
MNVAKVPYLIPVSMPHEGDLYRLKSSSRFTVIIYESLDCPACRKLSRRIEKDQQKFQDKFSLIYRNYPIFGNTSLVQDQSRIDLCVLKLQPERYWEFRRQVIELYPSFHLTALWLKKIAESFVKQADLDICKTSLSIQEKIEKDLLE